MSSAFSNNIIAKTLREVMILLAPQFKKKIPVMLVLMFTNGVIDVLGLATILPVLYLAQDQQKVLENPFLSAVYNFLHFGNTMYFLLFLIGVVFLVFVIKNIFGIWIYLYQSKFALAISRDITHRQFVKFTYSDYEYFGKLDSDVGHRNISRTPHFFALSIVIPLLLLFTEIIVISIILISIAIFNWRVIVLLVLTVFPIAFLFYNKLKERISTYGQTLEKLATKSEKFTYQAIHGIIDIKLSGKIPYFINKTMALKEESHRISAKTLMYKSSPVRVIELSAILGIVVLFIFSTIMGEAGSVLFSLLMIFAISAYRIMPSVNRILTSVIEIKGAQYVLKDLMNDEKRPLPTTYTHNNELTFKDEIKLEQIHFSYGSEFGPVLKGIDLTIKKGEVVGIIGESGSGKSTILKIILGLMKPTSGSLYVDTTKLTDEYQSSWFKLIGYVRQDFYIMDSTLAENIALGYDTSEIDYDRINDIIKMVKLDHWVSTLPNGINTVLGEFGSYISGGQRQRVAIARALYHDAEVIILDEATSALDSATEEEIMSTIYNLTDHKRTVIIVAHRITTLRLCNRIIEFDKGIIRKEWTYSDLIAQRLT